MPPTRRRTHAALAALAANGRVALPVLNEQNHLDGQLLETLPIPVLAAAVARTVWMWNWNRTHCPQCLSASRARLALLAHLGAGAMGSKQACCCASVARPTGRANRSADA